MATQTQHVLRIDAKRDYACSDNSMTLNNNANDCKPCITQAPLRSAVLLTAPHRLEVAVSRLSKLEARVMILNAIISNVLVVKPHSEHVESAHTR